MKVKLVDPMPLHPLLCYPGTSQPLRAIGLRSDGLPIWPHLGADGEEDTGGDEGGDEDNEDESEDEEDTENEDGGSSDNKDKSKKKSDTVSRADFDRLKKHLSESDRKKAELQKFKDEAERKGNTELQNLQKDHTKLTEDHTKLQGRFNKLALVNAFLTASAQEKITWHDPKVAQKAAELDDLEIDEDGNVEGIREAVKNLAKKSKYLVNSGSEKDEDEGEEKPARKRGPSGSGVGSVKTSKGKKDGQMSDDALRARFPALRR